MPLSAAGAAFLKWLLDFVTEHLVDFKVFLGELLKRRVLVALSLILLCSSIVLVIWYWKRASNYEEIINGTLTVQTESTPQNFKGLESFIFSNIPPGVSEALAKRPVNPRLIKKFQTLKNNLDDILSKKKIAETIRNGIFISIPNGASGDVFTDVKADPKKDASGYLFLPSYLLRLQSNIAPQPLPDRGIPVRLVTHDEKNQTVKEKQKAISIEDNGLAADVAFGRLLSETLQEISAISVTDDTQTNDVGKLLILDPAQIYVVTTSGVNRVFNQKTPHPSDLYGNQFPATTFFPDRPYFWPTFVKRSVNATEGIIPKDDALLGEFFYVSKPYLDLGGSGIVVTLTKGLNIPGLPQAAICVDIQFSPQAGLYSSLESLIRKLSGTVFKVACTLPPNSKPSCSPESASEILDDTRREMLTNISQKLSLAQESAERSKLLGNLQVVEKDGGKIRFSLPMTQDYSSADQKATLMLADIDINEYRRNTTSIALAAAICFVGMLSILGSVWTITAREKNTAAELERKKAEDLRKRMEEFESAFREVAQVMYHSPTPYLRLDSGDKIVDVSASFCRLLGFSSGDVSNVMPKVKGKTFKSFCADASSLTTYEEVEEKRKAGQAVEAYDLTLNKLVPGTVRVKVYSAAVPGVTHGELPQTFGVLVVEGPAPDSASDTQAGQSESKIETLPRKIM
jgi:PAS domain-containing protein